MRQVSLTTLLEETLRADFNVRVCVMSEEAVDENSPELQQVERRHELFLYETSSKERQARLSDYSHPITHQGFTISNQYLQIGATLVETAQRGESGRWRDVDLAVARRFFVLGIVRVPRSPEYSDQVQLDLWQQTRTQGRGR